MLIREVSDLHLEIADFFLPRMYEDAESVCVLSGDIMTAKGMGQATIKGDYLKLLKDLNSRFKAVVWVAGNHESYRYNIDKTSPSIKKFIKDNKLSNVHYLNKESVVIDDTAFIGATLWTDMNKGNPLSMFTIERGMNDFHVIKTGENYRKFKPIDAIGLHIQHKQFIFNEITNHRADGRKTVVVTHHCPSYQLVSPQYMNSELNGGYYSNLDDEIYENGPDLWFCGHTHSSHDIEIGATRIIVNPRGYARFFGYQKHLELKESHYNGFFITPEEYNAVQNPENPEFNAYLQISL